MIDVAIIGAGPAGLGAATHAAKKGLSHILFERKEVGNTIYEYQLRKLVMAEPQRLPLRADLPFQAGSREEILAGWNKAVKDCGVKIEKAEVTRIEKSSQSFEITASSGKFTARHVILGIGVQGTPRKLGATGEDQSHVHYTLSDPDALSGLNIVVVGAGDAAIENVLALCDRNKVSLINLSDDFPRAKEANAAKITDAIKTNRVKMFAHSSIIKIEKSSITVRTANGDVEAPCDHLIVRIGGTLPRKFLEDTGVQFPSKDPFASPVVSGRYESNVPGLFILGALIGYPLIKQGINQGFEVIEHILGNSIEPADQKLIEEALASLPGKANDNLKMIQSSLSYFKDLGEAQFRELIIESKIHRRAEGQIIFERNDYTDTFFSLISGQAKIELPGGQREILINEGHFFGEMGLLSGRRRVATVKAAKESLLLESPRKQILKLMKSVPSLKDALDRAFMLRALESSVFPEADAEFLKKLTSKASMRICKKGEVLFNEGDLGEHLYVIRKGSIKISRKNSRGANITQTYIAAGNVVGEMALISPEASHRSATATAAVGCELIVIDKASFQEVIAEKPQYKKRIEEIANERRLQNLKSEVGESSGALLDFMMLEGVTDADNVLVINSDTCIGCDNCEKACAGTHDGYSRLDRKGGKSFASIQIPISCRHCENPLCMVDCPPDALARLANGEVVIQDSCIGCGNCVRNCPYGVIQLVHEHKSHSGFNLFELLGFKKKTAATDEGPAKAAKCDLCRTLEGGPACVRSCPTGAALRVNPKELLKMVQSKT